MNTNKEKIYKNIDKIKEFIYSMYFKVLDIYCFLLGTFFGVVTLLAMLLVTIIVCIIGVIYLFIFTLIHFFSSLYNTIKNKIKGGSLWN